MDNPLRNEGKNGLLLGLTINELSLQWYSTVGGDDDDCNQEDSLEDEQDHRFETEGL